MTQQQRRAADGPNNEAANLLLTATANLIATEGPNAASSRAIAAAAGQNLGAITYYFGSKEQLITESLLTTARDLIQPVVDLLQDQEQDPGAKLIQATQMLQRLVAENQHHLSGYLQALAAATTNVGVGTGIVTLQRELSAVLAETLTRQLQKGLVPAWVVPEPMAQLMVGLANGIAIAAAIDPDHADAPAVGAQFAQLLLAAGLGPNPIATTPEGR